MKRELMFDCLPVRQGDAVLYMFSARATELWKCLQINQRDEDKDAGYQRVLSASRVRSIASYIKAKRPLPLSILITLEKARVERGGRRIAIKNVGDAGWVIDGQHRLAGAHESGASIELPVVAFLGLSDEEQIQQFITINREAKGVPASLYYDLLKHLPTKRTTSERAKERAVDIAGELKRDEESPFFGKIVVTSVARKGEISLNNFVRKVSPLVIENKGALSAYSLNEQRQIIANYYRALDVIFPKYYNKVASVFFQTVGFGALLNSLPMVFNLCLKHHKSFRVEDVARVLAEVRHFDFGAWERMGSGAGAESQAGEDLQAELSAAFDTLGEGGTIAL
ncbi:MAG: DGQHR domain-containing protein [Burkholderiales bacterium]|nr:DGQHR domain-containing protein [Burkholderiales bacterium]